MRKLKMLLAVSAIALVALAASATTAGAFTATDSPAGAITAASLGKLTFEGGLSIRCNVTLTGSLLAGPITIAAGNRIGSITGGTWANCEGGEVAEILVSAANPWSITINSVPAGLPNSATSMEVLVNRSAFELSVFGGFVECLYQGNAPASLAVTGNGAGVYTTGLETVLTNSESLVEGGFGCPSRGTFRGSFSLTRQTITVR